MSHLHLGQNTPSIDLTTHYINLFVFFPRQYSEDMFQLVGWQAELGNARAWYLYLVLDVMVMNEKVPDRNVYCLLQT